MYPPPQEGVIQRSFGAGELAPALHARADQVKYLTGLRTCRNFLVLRAGGVANRPGTRFIAECKTASASVQLLPYASEIAGESILIEAGNGYLRFFKNGAAVEVVGVAAWSAIVTYTYGDLVVQGGVNYWAKIPSLNQAPPNATFWYPLPGDLLEIPHGFGADRFSWSQSGRTLTLTHEDHPPQELTYQALTRWTVKTITTAPQITAPTALVLTPGAAGTRRFAYVVTAVAAETYEESQASGAAVDLASADPTTAAPHLLTWTPVAGAVEYYIYLDPYNNGTYGFVGTATGAATFHDIGFIPDFTVTPPLPRILFATTNNYPRVATTYQQRRLFGYTKTTPDAVFGSRTGFPSNFGISSPLQDDDAITFRIAGGNHHPIRHLIGLKTLVVLTDAGEWNVLGGSDGVLAPNAINPDQKTYSGAHSTRPVVIGNSIIYLQARGRIWRDLRFDVEVEGLAGRDLTVFSSHLVDGHTFRRLEYAQTPHSIVWGIRDDGVLLGLTYLREQDVWGWHRHDTEASGEFFDVCVVPEADDDAVYFIVKRTIDGGTVRYIERLAPRDILDFDEDAFFVDAGLSYSGAPVNNIAGLDHLEGEVVAVVGDGDVIYDGDPDGTNAANFTVTGGTLPEDLPASYSEIHAGLPIRFAEIELLDLDVQGTDARAKLKRVGGLDVLLDASSRSFFAGPDVGHLRHYTAPVFEPASDAFTGIVEMNLDSTFNRYGRVLIRQTDPLPLTILGVIPRVELGG